MARLMTAKAEIVFGAQLVLRHRTVRIAGLFALAIVWSVLMRGYVGLVPGDASNTVLSVVGALATVAGSRLLAPGAALAASRRVAAEWWLVPMGRLTGAVVVLLPAVLIAVFVVNLPGADSARLCFGAIIYAAALASFSLAITPVVGASLAAVVGFVGVAVGVLSPSSIGRIFDVWPIVQRPLLLLWHVLPLHWRVGRILNQIEWFDLFVLLFWVGAGIVGAALATHSKLPSDRHAVENAE